jgi:hypothetical protein
MDLDQFQAEVGAWGDVTFPTGTATSVLAHLTAEVTEELTIPAEPLEIADCFLLLIQLAHKSGVSLAEVGKAKMVINRQRTWGTPDPRGFTRHDSPSSAPPVEDAHGSY